MNTTVDERKLAGVAFVVLLVTLYLAETLAGGLPFMGILFGVAAGYMWLRWQLTDRSDAVKYIAIALSIAAAIFILGIDQAISENFSEGDGLIQKVGQQINGPTDESQTFEEAAEKFNNLPFFQKSLFAVAALFLLEFLRRKDIASGPIIALYCVSGFLILFAGIVWMEQPMTAGTRFDRNVSVTSVETNSCSRTNQSNKFLCSFNAREPFIYAMIGGIPSGGSVMVVVRRTDEILAYPDPEGLGGTLVNLNRCIFGYCNALPASFEPWLKHYPFDINKVGRDRLLADMVNSNSEAVGQPKIVHSRGKENFVPNGSSKVSYLRLRLNAPDELASQRGLKASKIIVEISIYSRGGGVVLPPTSQ